MELSSFSVVTHLLCDMGHFNLFQLTVYKTKTFLLSLLLKNKLNRLKTLRFTTSLEIFRDDQKEKHDFSRITEDIKKAEIITFINSEIILSLQSLNRM